MASTHNRETEQECPRAESFTLTNFHASTRGSSACLPRLLLAARISELCPGILRNGRRCCPSWPSALLARLGPRPRSPALHRGALPNAVPFAVVPPVTFAAPAVAAVAGRGASGDLQELLLLLEGGTSGREPELPPRGRGLFLSRASWGGGAKTGPRTRGSTRPN